MKASTKEQSKNISKPRKEGKGGRVIRVIEGARRAEGKLKPNTNKNEFQPHEENWKRTRSLENKRREE